LFGCGCGGGGGGVGVEPQHPLPLGTPLLQATGLDTTETARLQLTPVHSHTSNLPLRAQNCGVG